MKKKDKVLLGAGLLIIILIVFLRNTHSNTKIVEGLSDKEDKDKEDKDKEEDTCENITNYTIKKNEEIKIKKEDATSAEDCSNMCGAHNSTEHDGVCQAFSFNEKEKSCKLHLYSREDNNCLYVKHDSHSDSKDDSDTDSKD
tara:strand:+ start:486 stop:911 length:426 start_codon:yes stop_codon:yes gene_type:complete